MPDRGDGVARQPDGDEFAARLREWRRTRGLTQERLADVSGLSVRAIRDMEGGRVRAPQRRTASMLAEALRLTGPERESFLALVDAIRTRPAAAPDQAAAPQRARPPAEPHPGVPGELPPAINDLIGRDADLAALSALATVAAAGRDTGPVVVVLHGPAGIGKTSLAVSAGHQARPGFPGGQLFVDLLGGTGTPLDPIEVLGRFLRSLGTPDSQLPATLAERTALYRTVTRDRRLVVVLDNAADERQVRPLLPAGAGCLVLISSRRPLTGLDAVERLALTALGALAGSGLLRAIIGQRAVDEAGATTELVELCGHLPLALRIAGNRLASRPSWSVAHLVGQLRDQRQRLTALTAGDRGVRAAFAVSYRQLTPTAAAVFRRCALLAHPGFGTALAAVTVDLIEDVTAAALEELVDAGLLLAAAERYRFHDLVRLFSSERLEADEPVQAVAAARERMVSWLLERTAAAGATFEPAGDPADDAGELGACSPPPDPGSGRARRMAGSQHAGVWLDQEFPQWWQALRLAAHQGRRADVIRVVRSLHWYSDVTAHRYPWDEVFRLGVAAAGASGDQRDEAVLTNFLGWALFYCRERYADALAAVDRARSLAQHSGDQREEAWALTYRAAILVRTGEAAAAIEPARRAVHLFDRAGFPLGATSARSALATAYTEVGDFAEALDIHQEVLAFYRGDSGLSPAGRMLTEAGALTSVGRDLAGLGRWAAAAQAYAEAVDLFVGVGDEFGEGRASYYLALARRELGEHEAAAAGLRRAVELFVAVHSTSWAERARQALR